MSNNSRETFPTRHEGLCNFVQDLEETISEDWLCQVSLEKLQTVLDSVKCSEGEEQMARTNEGAAEYFNALQSLSFIFAMILDDDPPELKTESSFENGTRGVDPNHPYRSWVFPMAVPKHAASEAVGRG